MCLFLQSNAYSGLEVSVVLSEILANESPYRQKSEQQCFQKMSSCPFSMSVGDHGDLYGALAD